MKFSGIAAAMVVGALAVGVVACSSSSSPGYPSASYQLGEGCVAASTISGQFSQAVGRGASVVTAHGTYTGTKDSQNPFSYGMRLDEVRTIGGMALPASLQGWIQTIHGADTGSLWAPDGSVLAIAQLDANSSTNKPVYDLTIAPLVNGQVVFSTAGCWPTATQGTTTFNGPLQEIPGSGTYNQAKKLGFHAMPLATVELMVGSLPSPSASAG